MYFRKIYKCRNATTCTNSEGAVKLSFFPPPVSLTFMHTKIPLIIVLCTITVAVILFTFQDTFCCRLHQNVSMCMASVMVNVYK